MSDETQQDEGFVFVSRYGAGPGPDVTTMCPGQCEGMGCYPVGVAARDLTDYERGEIARIRAEKGDSEDGWYFIRCGDCDGTGKRPHPAPAAPGGQS